MLYQLSVADLRRPLAPGWEQDIDDELLREDIAAATDGNPARRLASVTALTDRLRSRDARRDARQRLRDAEVRAHNAERLLERSRERRPWIATAAVLLLDRRSEERRVGKERVRTCNSRWSPCPSKKK